MYRYNIELWQRARDKLRDRGNFPSCPASSGKNIFPPSLSLFLAPEARVPYSVKASRNVFPSLVRIKQSLLARARVPYRARSSSYKWNTGIPESRPRATRCAASPSLSGFSPSSSSSSSTTSSTSSSKSSGLKLWPPASSPARYTSGPEVFLLSPFASPHRWFTRSYIRGFALYTLAPGPSRLLFPSARPSPLSPVFVARRPNSIPSSWTSMMVVDKIRGTDARGAK